MGSVNKYRVTVTYDFAFEEDLTDEQIQRGVESMERNQYQFLSMGGREFVSGFIKDFPRPWPGRKKVTAWGMTGGMRDMKIKARRLAR